MFKRALGGLAAVVAAVGAAHAQPAFAPRAKPAFVPSKQTTADVEQAAMKVDGTPAPAKPVPVVTSPVLGDPVHIAAPAPAPCPDLACPADVAAACGESCGAASDCLCGPPGRFWIGGQWLYWTTTGNNLPPLVTSAPPGTPRGVAGTIGGPGTGTLIGNQSVNDNWRSGVRLYGGMWFDECQRFGIEGDFFYLASSKFSGTAGSNGTDIITRPFTNNVRRNTDGTFAVVAPYQDTQLVSFPGILAGNATVTSDTDFIGGGFNFVRNLCCNPCGRLDFLLGYRYLNLNDTLTINEDLTGISPNPGTRFQVTDRFRTENHFHGGNIGLAWEQRFSHFFLGVRSSVALGVTRSIVDIDGSTIITPPGGAPQQYVGGLLAQPSNIGRYEKDTFAVVPEIGVRLGVQVTDHLRVFGGYNAIYWSSVVRPENVIDLRVNASQIPPRTNPTGPQFPIYSPSTTGFWAHGVMVGVELRY